MMRREYVGDDSSRGSSDDGRDGGEKPGGRHALDGVLLIDELGASAKKSFEASQYQRERARVSTSRREAVEY